MKNLFARFPFLTLAQALLLLRLTLAMLFMAHAGFRFTVDNYFVSFGTFLEGRGLIFGTTVAMLITALELSGGILLILNRYAKWVAAVYFSISAVGIVLIHARLGWFVGEFGEGGVEYSVILCVACLVVAAADNLPAEKTA